MFPSSASISVNEFRLRMLAWLDKVLAEAEKPE